MTIKEIFGKDYRSEEDYIKVFQEIFDEYDNKIELSRTLSICYKEDSGTSYGIHLIGRNWKFDNYLDTGKEFRLYKRISLVLNVPTRKAIRLDTIKEELEIQSNLINSIIFCLDRLDINPKSVSVSHERHSFTFDICKRIEFTEDEENEFLSKYKRVYPKENELSEDYI